MAAALPGTLLADFTSSPGTPSRSNADAAAGMVFIFCHFYFYDGPGIPDEEVVPYPVLTTSCSLCDTLFIIICNSCSGSTTAIAGS